MKVKVCGLRQAENIAALAKLPLDFTGFIFYEQSARYVSEKPEVALPEHIQKVGVFVNATFDEIEEKIELYALDYIQLHGDETAAFCQELSNKGYKIIKAFSVGEGFEWSNLQPYEAVCNFFLLDTKGASYGGNGTKFDWSILKAYPYKIPFFLSGGITYDSVEALRNIDLPQLYAVDINSRFEEVPAIKNVALVQQFIEQLQA